MTAVPPLYLGLALGYIAGLVVGWVVGWTSPLRVRCSEVDDA